jgi:osmotically inducible lipoprotein OsmB
MSVESLHINYVQVPFVIQSITANEHTREWRQTMKRITRAAVVLVPLLALGACGQGTGERAASGAGIGAGVGALGGLLVGAPLEGALIGGAVGAGTGALTSERQINLGRPIWR